MTLTQMNLRLEILQLRDIFGGVISKTDLQCNFIQRFRKLISVLRNELVKTDPFYFRNEPSSLPFSYVNSPTLFGPVDYTRSRITLFVPCYMFSYPSYFLPCLLGARSLDRKGNLSQD